MTPSQERRDKLALARRHHRRIWRGKHMSLKARQDDDPIQQFVTCCLADVAREFWRARKW